MGVRLYRCALLPLLGALAVGGLLYALRVAVGKGKEKSLRFIPEHGQFQGQRWEEGTPGCKLLLGDGLSMEDLTQLGDGRRALATAGPVWQAALHGPRTALQGLDKGKNARRGIYVVDAGRKGVDEPTVTKLSVLNKASMGVLHGIYFSQKSKRVYAVNHAKNFSSVEVLALLKDLSSKSGFTLKHVASVRHPLLLHNAINDVVEGTTPNEVFVSQWRAENLPEGTATKSALWKLTHSGEMLFGVKKTKLVRCQYEREEAARCAEATSDQFVGANGLAITPDRKYLFVNDPAAQEVLLYKTRMDSGQLQRLGSIRSMHVIDNSEVVDYQAARSGAGVSIVLHLASVPLLYTTGTVCEDRMGMGARRPIHDTQGRPGFVDCGRSPGGILEIRVELEGEVLKNASQSDVLMHDGSVLSQISAAFELRESGRFVLGGVGSPGVLVCDTV